MPFWIVYINEGGINKNYKHGCVIRGGKLSGTKLQEKADKTRRHNIYKGWKAKFNTKVS